MKYLNNKEQANATTRYGASSLSEGLQEKCSKNY